MDWVHVHAMRGIELDGWVPARARELFWESPPAPTGIPDTLRRHWRGPIYALPVATTPAIAQLLDDAAVAVLDTSPGGWLHIAASWVDLRFEGWTRPPPPPSPRAHIYDFPDDLIDGVPETHRGPLAAAPELHPRRTTRHRAGDRPPRRGGLVDPRRR